MNGFRVWLENQIIQIPLGNLLISRKGLVQAFNDYKDGRESRTAGPVHVWQTEDNKYQLVDGYHRIVNAILHGQQTIQAEIIGRGYSDYWAITKPKDQFQYKSSMTYNDLQDVADKELLDDLVGGNHERL